MVIPGTPASPPEAEAGACVDMEPEIRFSALMTPEFSATGIRLIVLGFSLATGIAQEPTKPSGNSAVDLELQRLEKVWNDAHLAGNTAALDGLWANELVVTVPKMPLFSKAQSLAIWRTGRMKFKRYETSDLVFRVFGDTAIVTGALIRDRKSMEQDIHEDWRFTKVYVRRDGKWQVVAWHASESAPP